MSDHQERWRRVTALFHAALERPPAEREAFVIDACGDDAVLLAELRSLLSGHERASEDKLFDHPAVGHDRELMAEAGSGESLVGKTVGRYRIQKKISEGGMGIVYLAEDTKLHRLVAFKALPAAFTADPARRERHRREALAAAQLSHNAVAVVYDLEETDDGSFITSEYIEGHNLREEVARGPLPVGEVLEIACAVASALAAAHALGIVHRDLKPENVMRARNGAVKVLDYGLALLLPDNPDTPTRTRLTMEGGVIGTPGYMPPEQLRGLSVDARADVYSFGVLLHELATGRMPGSGTPVALPARLDRIIRKCLAPDPADRFQNGAAIVAALETARAGRGTPGPGPQPPIWWWQFHQVSIAMLHASLLVGVWFARGWLDRPWRTLAFFGAIGAAIADVLMRLNLWFISREQPGTLASQRARYARALPIVDVAYAVVLCALAAAGAQAHEALAALLVGGAIVSLLALLLIEPATSRTAFGRPHRATPKELRSRRRTPRRPSPRQ